MQNPNGIIQLLRTPMRKKDIWRLPASKAAMQNNFSHFLRFQQKVNLIVPDPKVEEKSICGLHYFLFTISKAN